MKIPRYIWVAFNSNGTVYGAELEKPKQVQFASAPKWVRFEDTTNWLEESIKAEQENEDYDLDQNGGIPKMSSDSPMPDVKPTKSLETDQDKADAMSPYYGRNQVTFGTAGQASPPKLTEYLNDIIQNWKQRTYTLKKAIPVITHNKQLQSELNNAAMATEQCTDELILAMREHERHV